MQRRCFYPPPIKEIRPVHPAWVSSMQKDTEYARTITRLLNGRSPRPSERSRPQSTMWPISTNTALAHLRTSEKHSDGIMPPHPVEYRIPRTPSVFIYYRAH